MLHWAQNFHELALMKIVKIIVLTVKQPVELIEKFDNKKSVTGLAKDYGVGTE
jgi:hypothetical protein